MNRADFFWSVCHLKILVEDPSPIFPCILCCEYCAYIHRTRIVLFPEWHTISPPHALQPLVVPFGPGQPEHGIKVSLGYTVT